MMVQHGAVVGNFARQARHGQNSLHLAAQETSVLYGIHSADAGFASTQIRAFA